VFAGSEVEELLGPPSGPVLEELLGPPGWDVEVETGFSGVAGACDGSPAAD
jgi:hypothetical protein